MNSKKILFWGGLILCLCVVWGWFYYDATVKQRELILRLENVLIKKNPREDIEALHQKVEYWKAIKNSILNGDVSREQNDYLYANADEFINYFFVMRDENRVDLYRYVYGYFKGKGRVSHPLVVAINEDDVVGVNEMYRLSGKEEPLYQVEGVDGLSIALVNCSKRVAKDMVLNGYGYKSSFWKEMGVSVYDVAESTCPEVLGILEDLHD